MARGIAGASALARARASQQSEKCEQGGNANKTMTCWLKRSGVKGSGNAMWAQPKVGVAVLCTRLYAPAFEAVRPPPCTLWTSAYRDATLGRDAWYRGAGGKSVVWR